METFEDHQSTNSPRQPIFNVPSIVLFLLAVMAAIHGIRVWLLDSEWHQFVIINFAFIPYLWPVPGGQDISEPLIWLSPISYSFLHSDWTHLGVNSLWMVVFGTVVARRLQPQRFLMLCILASMGGAFVHYISHIGELVPMIGASAIVSACMGAATRFAFPRGGGFERENINLPRLSLIETFMNRQLLAFIAIWFAINYIFGAGMVNLGGGAGTIAWQAHIGGFVVGLLLFPIFDPVKR